ncbi:MAG: hypothetical protein RL477_1095 [Pseudomonadota bacterium]|jgi:TRAP transporter TAXI family solute receptor
MRDILKIYVPVILLVIGGFVFAWQFVDPAPSKTVTVATGAADGAYSASARDYQKLLAQSGITLNIRHTSGTVENLRLLADPKSGVDLAFVQSGVGSPSLQNGVATPGASSDLVSLASVFLEPLWVFVRAEAAPARLSGLKGKRIAVGAEGSGTKVLTLQLLAASGVTEKNSTLLAMSGNDGAKALEAGRVDAAVFVTGRVSETMNRLLRDPRVRLLDFVRADAYKAHFGYLARVTLPEGVLALDTNIPPAPVSLVAPTATLVARDDLHPAIVDLVLGAATKVHQPGSVFSPPGAFPSPNQVDFPLSEDARRYFKSGPTFLRRVLPFWLAVMVERLLIMLVPLVTLLIPLMKIAPAAYDWNIQRKLQSRYRELRLLEGRFRADDTPATRAALAARLEAMQKETASLKVPLSYAERLYHLRTHIDLMRRIVAG